MPGGASIVGFQGPGLGVGHDEADAVLPLARERERRLLHTAGLQPGAQVRLLGRGQRRGTEESGRVPLLHQHVAVVVPPHAGQVVLRAVHDAGRGDLLEHVVEVVGVAGEGGVRRVIFGVVLKDVNR